MKRILKWNVPVDGQPHEIGGGRVVHVDCQDGPEIIQVWTEEWGEDSLQYPKRPVKIVGTGQDFNSSGTVVGTVMHPAFLGGWLVWHVVRF